MDPQQNRSLVVHQIIGGFGVGVWGLVVAWSLSVFAVHWDPCVLLQGFVGFALGLTLAVMQFRSTFRFHAKTTKLLVGAYGLIGGLWTLGCFCTGAQFLLSGRLPLINFVTFWGIPAAAMALLCWSNFRWLLMLQIEEPPAKPLWRITLKESFGLVTGAACICAVAMFLWGSPGRTDIEPAPVILPPGASDVSHYYDDGDLMVYEFTTDEDAFLDWVDTWFASGDEHPLPISEPCEITRYTAYDPDSEGPDSVVVTKGWVYESDHSLRQKAVFDSNTRRAYVHAGTPTPGPPYYRPIATDQACCLLLFDSA